ncbi:hemerythrin [Sporobacter termitidis DSM 10068]|uniref:Hemerythrin n=1 Tax=Sporobacter termitidis DSM 10068 TaxID=1123282 RepID=A0A1M5WV81_9FIRM|nr:bacteriohemerythrin [Sporobacter termitidis]SHH91034.1 hemerythrin [Sporobacter termitidis DSM 10068]
MEPVKWDESISVGVEALDSDHRRLVGMINKLAEALDAGESDKVLLNLLNGMKNYAIEHFSREESYMLFIKYPGLKAHKEQHARFVRKVIGFEADYKRDRALLGQTIMPFLMEWLIGHIMESDKKYCAYIPK